MPVIALLNQKGGVGKTTLATHLATALALARGRVLYIDADPQGSGLDWSAARSSPPLFPVIGLPTATIHRDIAALAAPYEWVIIDGPPRVSTVAKSAMAASDLVVIPVQPSPYDVWAAKEIVDLITEVTVMTAHLKAVFAVNRKIVGTAIGRDVVAAFAAYPIPVLPVAVSQRVAFAESAATGQTVLELEPEGAAARDIRRFVAACLEYTDAEIRPDSSVATQ